MLSLSIFNNIGLIMAKKYSTMLTIFYSKNLLLASTFLSVLLVSGEGYAADKLQQGNPLSVPAASASTASAAPVPAASASSAGAVASASASVSATAPQYPAAEVDQKLHLDSIRKKALELDASQESGEKLVGQVEDLLQRLDGRQGLLDGIDLRRGIGDENVAWKYWRILLSLHGKATTALLEKNLKESQKTLSGQVQHAYDHNQVFYALLLGMSYYKTLTGDTLANYFTHENAEVLMDEALHEARVKVLPKLAEYINAACKNSIKAILWRMFVKEHIRDETLESLRKMRHLDLVQNNLSSLPEEIRTLTNLETLALNHNVIKVLPEGVSKLTRLQSLYLGVNQLITIPEDIGKLTKLVTLRLYYNQLTSLPKSIGRLQNLQNLEVEGNPLADQGDGQLTWGMKELNEYFGTPTGPGGWNNLTPKSAEKDTKSYAASAGSAAPPAPVASASTSSGTAAASPAASTAAGSFPVPAASTSSSQPAVTVNKITPPGGPQVPDQ